MTHFRLSAWFPIIWGLLLVLIILMNTQNSSDIAELFAFEMAVIGIMFLHTVIIICVAVFYLFQKHWQYSIQVLFTILILFILLFVAASLGAGFSQ